MLKECKTCQGETRQERDTAVERHGRRETQQERDTAGKKHGRRETQQERDKSWERQ